MDELERIRRQTIMSKNGINVKNGDPWVPWQQEQWDNLNVNLRQKIDTRCRLKNIELIFLLFSYCQRSYAWFYLSLAYLIFIAS